MRSTIVVLFALIFGCWAQAALAQSFFRLVCEEVNHRGVAQGQVMVLDQIPNEGYSGELMLERMSIRTPEQDFLLRFFTGRFDEEMPVAEYVETLMTQTPMNGGGDGEIFRGDFLANTFLVVNGDTRAKFRVGFHKLSPDGLYTTGSFYQSGSRIATNGYDCAPPYVVQP